MFPLHNHEVNKILGPVFECATIKPEQYTNIIIIHVKKWNLQKYLVGHCRKTEIYHGLCR
jgi:hypothetical protein